MKSLKPYLKGIVIFLAMAVFGAIFLFGRQRPTRRPRNKKNEAGSAESDSTSEEVRAAVTQMTDLQKKIDSLQAQLNEQAAEDEELQKLTENRISAVQERINAATESEAVPEQVARLLDDVSTRLESIERQVSTRPQSTLPDYEVEGALPGRSHTEILWIDSVSAAALGDTAGLIDFAEQLETQASGTEPEAGSSVYASGDDHCRCNSADRPGRSIAC